MADRKGAGQKQVFLSYDRERAVEAFAAKLKQDLEKNGFRVFLDVEDIPRGSNWVDGVSSGLCDSMGLVVIITDAYVASSYCSKELFIADSDSKPIFPVIFEDVNFELSEKLSEVKFVISGLSWSFFRPDVDNHASSLARLMQGLTRHGFGPNALEEDASALTSRMSRLFITPGRPTIKSDAHHCDQSNAHVSLPSSCPLSSLKAEAPPLDPHSSFTTPQRNLPTSADFGCTPVLQQVSKTRPIQPYATPSCIPYHPGFSPQYPFAGYVPPLGYAIPYTTDSIIPVPLSQEEIDRQALDQTSAITVPPISKVLPKDRFRVGIKVEALDRRFPYYVCVATIKDKKENGQVMIHFDGWGPEYDYWCDADDIELHPVGWCSKHDYELYPTRGIEWRGWNKYLADTQSEGADSSYFNEVQLAPPGSLLFRPGMRLEAKDPKNPEEIRVATIKSVTDKQILVHFDGRGDENDFWSSPDSPDIHPAMWCNKHQKKVAKPNGHMGDFRWNRYLARPDINPAPAHCFTEAQLGFGPVPKDLGGLFEVGMKLEAKDRKNPGLICVATITEIQGNRLLIHFDGWSKCYDYWCQPDTVDIHPIGWCEEYGYKLQKPKGFFGEFSWDLYLSQGAIPAPENAFSEAQKN